jgi:hypothetical protein
MLAMFAAMLLLITCLVGFEGDRDVYASSPEIISSAKVDSAKSDKVNDSVEHKRRGLNLGLLLFRRG